MLDMLLVILYLSSGLAASWEARRKGYNDWLFLALGILLGPLSLIVLWFVPPRRLAVGTPVRPAARIQLDRGGIIPPSHVTVVRAVREIDGVTVCQITAPDGSKHWVAQEAIHRMGRPE